MRKREREKRHREREVLEHDDEWDDADGKAKDEDVPKDKRHRSHVASPNNDDKKTPVKKRSYRCVNRMTRY